MTGDYEFTPPIWTPLDTFRKGVTKLGDSVAIDGNEDFELVEVRTYSAHLDGNFTDEEIDDGEDLYTITAYIFYCLLDDEDENGNFVDTPIWYMKVYTEDDYDYYNPLVCEGYLKNDRLDKIDEDVEYNLNRICKDLSNIEFVCTEKVKEDND